MELLTLACLDHLPRAAVAFVTDGTGLCGTSVEDQWALRQELRRKYGARIPWVDVLTKADLLRGEYGLGEGAEGGRRRAERRGRRGARRPHPAGALGPSLAPSGSRPRKSSASTS